jgi:hypothetical protein
LIRLKASDAALRFGDAYPVRGRSVTILFADTKRVFGARAFGRWMHSIASGFKGPDGWELCLKKLERRQEHGKARSALEPDHEAAGTRSLLPIGPSCC